MAPMPERLAFATLRFNPQSPFSISCRDRRRHLVLWPRLMNDGGVNLTRVPCAPAISRTASRGTAPIGLQAALGRALPVFVGIAAVVWCFWPVVVGLVREWNQNEDYSVGQLVPLVALYLVWHWRSRLAQCEMRFSLWAS